MNVKMLFKKKTQLSTYIIMQFKWTSATTYPNIVKKNSAPKKLSYTMHNFPVYYVCHKGPLHECKNVIQEKNTTINLYLLFS
jgi:hypothetical protein